MFIITCKYSSQHNYIFQLIQDIQKFHTNARICVVDSDSEDKTYLQTLKEMGVLAEDAKNQHYHVGGYWYGFKKYPDEDFYYFLHDAMRIKDNLDYLKEHDFKCIGHFQYGPGQNMAANQLAQYTKYDIINTGYGIGGPIFFCKNWLIKKLYNNGVDKLLPTHNFYTTHLPNGQKISWLDGISAPAMERCYGCIITQEGFNIPSHSLLGDICFAGQAWFSDGNTSWQYPLEKFTAIRQ
jgi:hypothetical protein